LWSAGVPGEGDIYLEVARIIGNHQRRRSSASLSATMQILRQFS